MLSLTTLHRSRKLVKEQKFYPFLKKSYFPQGKRNYWGVYGFVTVGSKTSPQLQLQHQWGVRGVPELAMGCMVPHRSLVAAAWWSAEQVPS